MKARASTATLPNEYKAAAQEYFKEHTGLITERTLYAIALALHDRGHRERYIVDVLRDFYEIYEGYNELANAQFARDPGRPTSEINDEMKREAKERGVEITIRDGRMELVTQPRKRKSE